MPIVCTFCQSGDYLGVLQDDPVGPGIGFYSSVFPNTGVFHISPKCLVASAALPGYRGSVDHGCCSWFVACTSEVNRQGCFVSPPWLLLG